MPQARHSAVIMPIRTNTVSYTHLGCLADIAPTLIELMGLEQPKEMTGKSLLVK